VGPGLDAIRKNPAGDARLDLVHEGPGDHLGLSAHQRLETLVGDLGGTSSLSEAPIFVSSMPRAFEELGPSTPLLRSAG
jgi:hypothetical protein